MQLDRISLHRIALHYCTPQPFHCSAVHLISLRARANYVAVPHRSLGTETLPCPT